MSGEIPDVIGGQTIAVAWGNPVKDRTVMRYQNVAERDSLIPSPVIGDVAFVEEFVEVAGGVFESALTIYGNVPVGSWHVVWQGTNTGPYLPLAGGTLSGVLEADAGISVNGYVPVIPNQVREIWFQNDKPATGDGKEGDVAVVLALPDRGVYGKSGGNWILVATA